MVEEGAQAGKRRRVDSRVVPPVMGIRDSTKSSLLFPPILHSSSMDTNGSTKISLMSPPIPQENIQPVIPARNNLSHENIFGGILVSQEHNMEFSTALPFLITEPTNGTSMGFTGSILNFQNPFGGEGSLSAQKCEVSQAKTMAQKKKSGIRGSEVSGGKREVAKECLTCTLTLPDLIMSSSTSMTPGDSSTSLKPLLIFSTEKVSETPPPIACSNSSGIRNQAVSPPLLDRSSATPVNTSPLLGCDDSFGILPTAHNSTTSTTSSSGRASNRLSVMGPVSTHHEQ